MKEFNIEWKGVITRDIGWENIKADSLEEAKSKFLLKYGQYHKIISVYEIKLMSGIVGLPIL